MYYLWGGNAQSKLFCIFTKTVVYISKTHYTPTINSNQDFFHISNFCSESTKYGDKIYKNNQ